MFSVLKLYISEEPKIEPSYSCNLTKHRPINCQVFRECMASKTSKKLKELKCPDTGGVTPPHPISPPLFVFKCFSITLPLSWSFSKFSLKWNYFISRSLHLLCLTCHQYPIHFLFSFLLGIFVTFHMSLFLCVLLIPPTLSTSPLLILVWVNSLSKQIIFL